MKEHIRKRVLDICNHILDTKETVRQTATIFAVSKSTVHKDVAERLRWLDPALYREVREILQINKSERHIRGGLATKEKYMTLTARAHVKKF